MPDTSDVVEQHWPYDGPHDDYTTGQAAEAIALLVRYLNNATGQLDGVYRAPALYCTLGGLSAAAHGLDQLLEQLAGFGHFLANDDTVFDDRPGGNSAETATSVAALLSGARGAARDLADILDTALGYASHLGHSHC